MDVSLFAGFMRVKMRPSSGIRTTGREKGLSIWDSGTTGSLLQVQGGYDQISCYLNTCILARRRFVFNGALLQITRYWRLMEVVNDNVKVGNQLPNHVMPLMQKLFKPMKCTDNTLRIAGARLMRTSSSADIVSSSITLMSAGEE